MSDQAPLDPRQVKIPVEVLELVPKPIVRECCVLPVSVANGVLTLFCPDDPAFALEFERRLRFVLGRDLTWIKVSRPILEAAIDLHCNGLGATVENCEVKFRFQCPKRWENLELTGSTDQRFCPTCQRRVFLCSSVDEVQTLGLDGKCVAFFGAGYELLGDVAHE